MVMRVPTPQEWGRGPWNAARYPWDDRTPLRSRPKKKIEEDPPSPVDVEIPYNPPPVERIDGGNMLEE